MQKISTAVLMAVVISSLSLWGCTHQKNGATNAKIRELENRHAKLEEDYRVILAGNETSRRKIAQLETERIDLTQTIADLRLVVKERDELKGQLADRTEERNNAQVQLVQFSKDLQNLAGRIEAAATRSFGHALHGTPVSRKSSP